MLTFLVLLVAGLDMSLGLTVTDVTGSSTIVSAAVSAFNAERALFGLPALKWDVAAQTAAYKVASQCKSGPTYTWPAGMFYAFSVVTCDGKGIDLKTLRNVPTTGYSCSSGVEACTGNNYCTAYRSIISKSTTAIGCAVASCNFDTGTSLCGQKAPSASSYLTCFVSNSPSALSTPAAGLCKPATLPPPSNPPPTNPPPTNPPPSNPPPSNPPPAIPPPSTGDCTADPALQSLLAYHNNIRSAFGMPGLSLDCKLSTIAQNYANTCPTGHSDQTTTKNLYGTGEYVGENMAWATGQDVNPNGWGGEEVYWDCATSTCQSGKVCGHFTQIIWGTTTRVGCGIKKGCGTASLGDNVLVCNYAQGGNYVGVSPRLKADGKTMYPCRVAAAVTDTTAQSVQGDGTGVNLSVGAFVGIIVGVVLASMMLTFVIVVLISRHKRSFSEIQ